VTWARSTGAAIVISLIAAASIIHLNDNVSGYQGRQVELTKLESSAIEAQGAGWEAVFTALDGQSTGNRQSAAQSLVTFKEQIRHTEAVAAGVEMPADLAAAHHQFLVDLRAIAALIESGQTTEARDLSIVSDGVYLTLRESMVTERDLAVSNASRFRQISKWGTAATMLIAACFAGVLAWLTERTRRKAADAAATELRALAFVDSLTHLPNRTEFLDRLHASLERAAAANRSLAVLFLDIDDFKSVNDTMGHAAGDELITLVASRIEAAVRPSDACARLGGDEFAIIVDDIGDLEHSTLVTERILAAMDDPFEINGRQMSVHCSIGLAISEQGDDPADELMRNADVAMYVAKSRGKARFEIYEPSMHPELIENRELLDDLNGALERGELVNHYQPIVDLQTGRVTGAEALLRWNHPSRRLVPPVKFIPLAEQSGLIVPIGRWVLNEACRQSALWRIRHPENRTFAMHVNVSVRQLAEESFIDDLKAALHDFNTDPASLTLELTESMMLDDNAASTRRVEQIRELGVRIAIDDFGTGYSSLGYLQQFTVDAIKIDRSFTERLSQDGRNMEVTRSIVELGLSLGLNIVAEGIEHVEQVAAFRSLGCTHGQGYYYARPMPAGEFARLISREIFAPLARVA
jgi:diguanylate cyclase (GGDEF)-like protein